MPAWLRTLLSCILLTPSGSALTCGSPGTGSQPHLDGEGVGNTPGQLAALLRTESARYADIVKRANIKAE